MVTFLDLYEQHAATTFEKQQALLEEIGDTSWQFSLDDGTITFGGTRTFPIQILGTEADRPQTWLWGWANAASQIPPALLACANGLRALGQREGIAALTTPEISLEELDGRTIATVAAGICAADAFYRAPSTGGALFVLHDAPALGRHRPTTALGVINTFIQFIAQVPISHLAAFAADIAAKGGSTTPTAAGLDATLPGGDTIHATFDPQDRLTQLTTTQTPQ
jgi:hypothetical protein